MPPYPALALLTRVSKRVLPFLEESVRRLEIREVLDFGPVLLPPRTALSVRRPSRELSPQSGRHEKLAFCGFALSLLDDESCRKLFSRVCAETAHTLFFDFKMPERNLEWPSVLLFSLLRHSASRGLPEKAGGMEGVLYRERKRFSVLSRHTLFGGAFCGILVSNAAGENNQRQTSGLPFSE